jgi:hypothetical protein
MINPLNATMDWYHTVFDSMRLSRRAITKNMRTAINRKFAFAGKPKEEAIAMIDQSEKELNHVVILALVAAFESTVRKHLVDLIASNELPQRVRKTISKSIDRWRLSSQLIDVCDNPSIRGEVKQLVGYRDWVAHGGHLLDKPLPPNVRPVDAHKRLTRFLVEVGIIET